MTKEHATMAMQNERAITITDPAPDKPPRVSSDGPVSGPDADNRRRRRRRIGIAAFVGLGALWWVGWHSPLTVVEHVVVDAPQGVSGPAVRQASGISAADHVPSVDAETARLAIMAELPAVADVAVHRSLPHTIRLEVTPRTPLAAVRSGDGFSIVDAQGVVFDRAKQSRGLPVIRAGSDEDRERARELLVLLPESLSERVTRVTARSRDDITLALRGDRTVRWGSVDDTELKARVLSGLLSVRATRYDVSAPLLPTTSGSVEETETP